MMKTAKSPFVSSLSELDKFMRCLLIINSLVSPCWGMTISFAHVHCTICWGWWFYLGFRLLWHYTIARNTGKDAIKSHKPLPPLISLTKLTLPTLHTPLTLHWLLLAGKNYSTYVSLGVVKYSMYELKAQTRYLLIFHHKCTFGLNFSPDESA